MIDIHSLVHLDYKIMKSSDSFAPAKVADV